MLLQALFYYVWLEMPSNRKNFQTVLKLLSEAEVDDKKDSRLTIRMKQLAQTSPLGEHHPAYRQYMKVVRGAGDTVRSIIISANSRLALLENPQILRILSKDDLHIEELGIGTKRNRKKRTALFCVIPDSDKSYNFIVGMLYTQLFQELYYQADFKFGGKLPIQVTLMMDEFSNVALPDDFCSLLSTMRSRRISAVIIIQNLAQIKALFKDTWETITGNCDTLVYLGGNEKSTHEYISELLGKGTIDKRSTGETRGVHGSASRNYDVLGSVVLTGNVDTEQVAKEIAELSSLSTGDSKNVIDNLVTVMTRHLQSSESVTLDGLGTFRLTMKSTMNGVEDPLKVSATQSTLRVRFLPTSKRNLDHTVSTRSLVTGVKCVRFDLQDTAGSGGNDGGSGGNDGDQGENPLG